MDRSSSSSSCSYRCGQVDSTRINYKQTAMSNVRLALRVVCLFVVFSAIALHSCDARGARGGGFRGGSYRGSSYRGSSSYRSSSISRSFRSSSLRRGSSPFTRSNWVMNAALIYGATRYMRSRRYYDHPDDMPTVCDNRYDDSPNGTVYGYFICPREGEDDDMDYCCGDDHKEYCCRFADSPGRVAGIVIGCLVAVAVVSVCVFLLCRWKGVCAKKSKGSGGAVHYQVSQMPTTTPVPYSTTTSEKLPYSAPPGKEPLPEGDVSNAWGTPYSAYPPAEGAQAPPYDNPPMYPPPPTFPPDGSQPSAPGPYPSQPPTYSSQPPPPYGFNQ